MITGIVNSKKEAIIRLSVQGSGQQTEEIDAVIDTGFTGFLTLPSWRISSLNLRWLGRQQGILGDGSVQQFDVYVATVIWDGQPKRVEIDAAETEPLLGMSLLEGYELRIQAAPGGLVTIDALV